MKLIKRQKITQNLFLLLICSFGDKSLWLEADSFKAISALMMSEFFALPSKGHLIRGIIFIVFYGVLRNFVLFSDDFNFLAMSTSRSWAKATGAFWKPTSAKILHFWGQKKVEKSPAVKYGRIFTKLHND